MPTYEYECRDCAHRFETFQTMTARPLTKCPECGGRVRRLIGTGSGFIVKGGGPRGDEALCASCSRERPCCGRDEPCGECPQ